MSFEWGDYMQIAARMCALADTESDIEEAACRAAISRSYYALYNKCLAHHKSKWGDPLTYEGESNHTALEKAYRDKAYSFSDAARREAALAVADALDQYRRLRNEADYEDVLRGVKPKAARAVAKIAGRINDLSSI